MIRFKQFIEMCSKTIEEDMSAGDSGGSPENMASGETTGAITNKGAEKLGKAKKKDDDKK